MSFRITDHCTGCTACSKICPVQAITGSKNEIHVIHETNCIECGTCGRICPASSVVDSFGSQTLRIKRSLWEKPVFDYKTCMACVICVESCPSGVIGLKKINKKDPEAYPFLEDEKGCISCGFCKTDCPVDAVSLMVPLHEK